MRNKPTNLIAHDFEQISTLSGVVGLTSGTYSGALYATFYVTGSAIRYRDDGTNPDATTGMVLATGMAHPYLYIGPLNTIKFIETAADAVLNVSYYK